MLKAIAARGRDERGSALLIALVSSVVMIILGFALFDLTVLEHRLVTFSESEVRALETAQAGLERAVWELMMHMEAAGNLANGSLACSPAPCATGSFRGLSLAAGSSALNGGTSSVQLMLLTHEQASDLGFNCLPLGADALALCEDVALVRSTGSVQAPAGEITRTVQTLVKAESTIPLVGVTASSGFNKRIRGHSILAGSVQALGEEDGNPSVSFQGSGAGVRNNYKNLDKDSLARLTPPDLVCPKPSVPCTSKQKVESLGAVVKIKLPVNSPALELKDDSSIGEKKNTGKYGNPPRAGKGSVDAIYVADGCQGKCKDNFKGKTKNLYADGGYSRPCVDCLPSFPKLTDAVVIAGTAYPHYACPYGDGSCSGDFFTTHAARLDTLVPTYPNGCGRRSCPATLADIFGSTSPYGLEKRTPHFRASFNFKNADGTARTGEICWKRPLAPNYTLEFGEGTCDNLTSPQNPLLGYFDGPLRITASGRAAKDTVNYSGSALFLVRPTNSADLVKVEGSLQTACDKAPCPRRFPDQDMVGIMTFGNIEIARDKNDGDHERIMGLFYAEGDYYQQQDSKVIGSITAGSFCFAGACGDKGAGQPKFFQAPKDPRKLPRELFHGRRSFTVQQLPGFWKECTGPLPAGSC